MIYLYCMNFLAHIYLSNNDTEIEIGNFIADSVKGNNYLQYRNKIQQGILIHRKIDSYTDQHPVVKQAKKYFKDYNHYAGVIVDIVFDYFLAKNWEQFHSTVLPEFSTNFYVKLENYHNILPKRIQEMYPYMKSQNWLLMYATISGISDILFQMNRRTRNISKMNYSIIELVENHNELEVLFFSFFNDLKEYTKQL